MPAEDLIPLLFNYLGLKYYVCLLSAALFHGASHQKPQVFQVMAENQLSPLVIGKIRIEFIYKKSLLNLPTQIIAEKTGYLTLATPELTAMDLLLYPHHSGGINHIATVLSELLESINPEKLLSLIDKAPEKFWVQRLGYILENIDPVETKKRDKLIEAIYKKIENQLVYPVPLSPRLPTKGMLKNNRWNIIENTTIESDI